ncbi:MAG: hypothetical protein J0H67_17210 [Rhodospirillales bacterium]|nr:hypothetical protein [Rhodospirillales bacterium]
MPTATPPTDPAATAPEPSGMPDAADTATPSDAASPTDAIAGRARVVLPELQRPAPDAPPSPAPAPPTYAEMQHLLRDLA